MYSKQKLNTDRRRCMRLADYNYSSPGACFVTICTHRRVCLFGNITSGTMHLNPCGKIVESCWNELPTHYLNATLDVFVIMPNHVHGIIILRQADPPRHGLSEIVRGFKTFSARRINERRSSHGETLWQRGYFDHVIRQESSLAKTREYIANNPIRWHLDRNNPDNFNHYGPV